jgi:hypothetical protein
VEYITCGWGLSLGGGNNDGCAGVIVAAGFASCPASTWKEIVSLR